MNSKLIGILVNAKAFLNMLRYSFAWLISENRRTKRCLNKTNRDFNLVLSLTSFPGRINIIWQTLITLLNQTYKPDKIELWLAKDQFADIGIPKSIKKLSKYGIEIRYCEDVKSYKKLLPALKEHPDSVIITFDDDAFYKKDTVEKLMQNYLQHKKEIQCHRVTFLDINKDNSFIIKTPVPGKAFYAYKLVGIGGVLYPPGSLSDEVFDKNIYTRLAPTNDDIWFWFMAIKNKTKVRYIFDCHSSPDAIFLSYNSAKLSDQNDNDKHLFDDCLKKMLNEYDECKTFLLKERYENE